MADELAQRTGLPVDGSIVQTNTVGDTGADGFSCLARQARFAGSVVHGGAYVMVDDFIGQGGTLANLRGHIELDDGRAIAADVLPGKPYFLKLSYPSTNLPPRESSITKRILKPGG